MPRVLVVDDQDGPRKVLVAICELRLGFECSDIYAAKNGEVAMEIMTHLLPDIILTDLDMPKLDGFELTRRTKEKHPKIRIVLMSGSPEPKGHHADAFVKKPYTIDHLEEVVVGLLPKLKT